jgi:ADYC domain-containing protein
MPVIFALLLLVGTVGPATAAELWLVEADRTEFKVTLSDGTILRSADLVGAQMVIASGAHSLLLRLEAVERDPDAKQGQVWLHTFSTRVAGGSWHNPCEVGPDGRRQGFPLAGRVRPPDKMFEPAESGTFELACTAGAEGKCIRFGFFPWTNPNGLAFFNACIRMTRADYCGNGEPHTRAGIAIEIFDKNTGSRTKDSSAGMEFEAAWGPLGAVCVHRVRVAEIYSLDALRASCPRLKSEDIGAGCTETRVMQDPGVLLMNKSAVD